MTFLRHLLPTALASLLLALLPGCLSKQNDGGEGDASPGFIRITEKTLAPGAADQLLAEVQGDTPASRQFIERLWSQHHASFPPEQRVNYGPDSSFTQIEMVQGRERIVVGSWHLTERRNPKLFASHSGLGSLGDRTRAEALAAEPAAYQRFRASFDAVYDEVVTYASKTTKDTAATAR